MNPGIGKLITAIVSHVVGNGGYVTKPKLLKLLYLFDLEYYRIHQTTFTEFQWKFLHFGPWAIEYDQVLDGLLANNILSKSVYSGSDVDTEFYKSNERLEPSRVFKEAKNANALYKVLNDWGNEPTPEILDYVYFHTEPMENAIRDHLLDFTSVSLEPSVRYRRTPSPKSKDEIAKLRRGFEQRLAQKLQSEGSAEYFKPPKYDDEFFEALDVLAEMDS